MSSLKRVSSSNALKSLSSSLRRSASGNALSEMAGLAKSTLRRASSAGAPKDTKQVAEKHEKSIKGTMKKDSVQKVEKENVAVNDIEVDDMALAAKGFDPPVTQAPESENASDLVPDKTILAENLIQVMLFVSDRTTRRFELVKFDLDSSKARLYEILKEIPNVATDETLRSKKYVAICSRKGEELGKFKRVTEYFRREGNNKVSNFVLAVEEGMTAKDTVTAFMHILSDDKILSMISWLNMCHSTSIPSTTLHIF